MNIFLFCVLVFSFVFIGCSDSLSPIEYCNKINTDTSLVVKVKNKTCLFECKFIPADYLAINEVLDLGKSLDSITKFSKLYENETHIKIRVILSQDNKLKNTDADAYLIFIAQKIQDKIILKSDNQTVLPIMVDYVPVLPGSNFVDILIKFPISFTGNSFTITLNNILFAELGETEFEFNKEKINHYPVLKY